MHSSSYPIVVFDLDGTLAETAPDLISSLNAVLESENVAPLALEQARNLIGAGARALLERGLSAQGRSVSNERMEELFQSFLKHYRDNICVGTHLYPGVEKALRRLKDNGFSLAVCTNKFEEPSVALLEKLGIFDLFSAICGRDTFAYFKPDPRHLTETIARAKGDLHRAVMVGDSITDVDTAKAAKVPVICVPFGYSDKPVEALEPDRIIQHFDELFAAVSQLIENN